MLRQSRIAICFLSTLLLVALSTLLLAATDQAWKNKQYPEWTEDDAKQVMTDSPWAKTVVATPVKSTGQEASKGGHRGRTSIGGLGIGLPGIGGSGRHGGGQGGDADGGGSPKANGGAGSPDQPATLTLRWESALPMREAELKARDTGAPVVEDDFYAIAVYGIPRGILTDDSTARAAELKKQAVLKREGKSDIKPARVEILLRESGPAVVYLFPKSAEFTWRDHSILFEAQIARLKFSQAFSTDDMMFHGKLEL
jgi:hypothetical protein